ncbi:MAG: inositol monophosphatase [Fibrobacterales bacterium]
MNKFLQKAIDLAREAGALALAKQRHLTEIHYKDPKDIVTDADIACDQLIRRGLIEAFPEHNILTEEHGLIDNQSEYTWVIDPIDGTVNYSRGMPLWGISIGLLHKGIPILGVVNHAALDDLYTAIQGEGAFCNGRAISVSTVTDTHQCIINNGDFNVGSGHNPEAIQEHTFKNYHNQAPHFQRMKTFGSAVLEAGWVACGRLDAYCMTMSFPWDIVAITVIVQEAGGTVTNMDGSPLTIVDGAKVIFSNSHIHNEIVSILNN